MEGKVAAVPSAQDPMAAIGQGWPLLHELLPELVPATGATVVGASAAGADGDGGPTGRLINPVYITGSGNPFRQVLEMWYALS
jgi:hypothetical protein